MVDRPSPRLSSLLQLGVAAMLSLMPGVVVAQLRGATWIEAPGRVIRFGLASVLLLALVYGVRLRRARDRARILRRLNLRALPLLGAPLLPLLIDPNVVTTRGGLVLAAVVGWAACWWASRLAGREPRPRRAAKLEWYGVVAASLVVAAVLARLAWFRFASLQTNTYDLGLFYNALWNTAQGRWFVCTLVPTGSILDEHVSLALVPLAGLVRLGLRPTGLLVLQSVWICAGAIPLYSLARRHLGAMGGRVFALAYLLHPSLHSNVLWDFHPLSLAAPLLVLLVAYGERRRLHPWFVVSVVGLLMLREEMAFVLVAYAMTLALGGRTRRAVGLAAVAIGFLVALNLAMGHTSSHLSRYADVAEHGGGGLRGMMAAVLFDPAFVLGYALTYGKVVYVGMQGVGVLGAGWWVRRAWPMFALAFAFSWLAKSRHVYNPFFHYTTMLYPLVLAWAPEGISRLTALPWGLASRATRRRALLIAVAVASGLLSLAYGGLHDNDAFRAGFTAPRREISDKARQRLAWLQEQLAEIPPETAIAVTGRIGPHAAARPHVYAFPTERPVDVWVVFGPDLRDEQRVELRRAVARGEWRREVSKGSLQLYRRVSP